MFCEPIGVRNLWDEFSTFMVDDYATTSITTTESLTNRLLRDLNDLLIQHGKHISNFDLPTLSLDIDHDNALPRIIQEELLIPIPLANMEAVHRLNED